MKKILIISMKTDISTHMVVEWLKYHDKDAFIKVLNFDSSDNLENVKFIISQSVVYIEDKGNKIRLDDFDSYWYRRSGVFLPEINADKIYNEFGKDIGGKLLGNLRFEKSEFINSFYYLLENRIKNKLGSYFNADINKILQVEYAKEVGLDSPEYIISNDLEEISSFQKEYGQIITKSIGEGLNFTDSARTKGFITYTELIDDDEEIAHTMMPSLYQENVEKEYEIRSFYLDGKIYSMAIFSQFDAGTQIDFRKYDQSKKPNQNVPYELPTDICNKITKLMNKLNLNTGSIDLIKKKNSNQYYFLEVNPVGQFGMVSQPCNYNLEEKVALYLLK